MSGVRDAEDTPQALPAWFRISARVRGIATPVGPAVLISGVMGPSALPSVFTPALASGLWLAGSAVLVLGLALSFLPAAPRVTPRSLGAPVTGRWSAVNSPGTRVPSHRTHAYGQTFAIDLVHEPENGSRPKFGEAPGFRPPEDFPAFGRELVAPCDGRVVTVRDRAKDHRSRSTRQAFAYMILEGMVRELAGPRGVLGNHIILDLGDHTYAVFAHLQRGSAMVRPGQLVHRSQVIGRCGNSGNSSEPHLHFQLMDHPSPLVAAGVPFVFSDVSVDGREPAGGVPADGQTIAATGT
ncbi:M23 family metallopeptidase [Streptomyces sp. HUAS ZL42]|uniref:M23 family metallopeptidase n=1 Tax=Streptomyces sp. HUAS ZL42 TaxID=3231715 RepID=UPI00345E83F7